MSYQTKSCASCENWDTRHTRDGFGLCRVVLFVTTKDDGMKCCAYIAKPEAKPSEQKEGGNS